MRRAIDRRNRSNSQFRRFFDRPLHVIELENRHYQRNGHRGLSLDLGDQIEPHLRRPPWPPSAIEATTAWNTLPPATTSASTPG